jgi:hypothetical protein
LAKLPDSADRPATEPTEIEITPEMIEAGAEASCLFERDDPKTWEIEAVYRAMERVRRATVTDRH